MPTLFTGSLTAEDLLRATPSKRPTSLWEVYDVSAFRVAKLTETKF